MSDLTEPAELANRLGDLLRRHGEPEVQVTDVRPISGGYSLLTYGFSATTPVGRRRYVLRLDPPVGASLTHTDRRAEWELLSRLTAIAAVPMPTARVFDEGSVLGRPGARP
jgi:aminoglycoside phosphotransferase (APT) family kinase protein